MNLMAYMQGYMMKRSQDMPSIGNPVPDDLVLPKTPEEAEKMLEAREMVKQMQKQEKAEVRKEVAELDAQLAALRALKKKKEASLII